MYHLILIASLILSFISVEAQTIWTGPNITFTKDTLANWMLEENQDRLTDSVWITRANNKGIFNIVSETGFEGNGDDNFGSSPLGTEWAFGRTSDGVENLTFTTWIEATTILDVDQLANPPLLVDEEMVLHLIADDIYLDIKFLSWGQAGEGGGAFTYERATDQTTSADEDLSLRKAPVTVFPNPTSDYLLIQELGEPQAIEVINLLGVAVYNNRINPGARINISALSAGVYYVKLQDGRTTSFIKN